MNRQTKITYMMGAIVAFLVLLVFVVIPGSPGLFSSDNEVVDGQYYWRVVAAILTLPCATIGLVLLSIAAFPSEKHNQPKEIK